MIHKYWRIPQQINVVQPLPSYGAFATLEDGASASTTVIVDPTFLIYCTMLISAQEIP
jgi:hypothetical protein